MNRNLLILRNLLYHARSHVAVLFAAAVGTAVLAGALLVGDSLRGSLRDRTERQLGGWKSAMIAPRFFREAVADTPEQIPAILLQGSVSREGNLPRHAGKVMILGRKDAKEVLVSAPLAALLRVVAGDTIEINVQRASAIPRSSILGRRTASDSAKSFRVKVDRVADADDPANDFQLAPSAGTPLNLNLPLAVLQENLDQKGRVNASFSQVADIDCLQAIVDANLTLDDWGLKVHIPPKRKAYIAVDSKRLLLEPNVVEAVRKSAKELKYREADTFVYLANGIGDGKATIPYSIVAGLDIALAEPLGPFLPEGVKELKDDEIVLAAWRESPLKAKIGDTITVTFFEPEIEGEIKERTKTFTLKGFVSLEGPADDPDLTPEFPGITDKLSLSNWDPPFPYEQSRIQSRDENYWRRYKTTPKAYITLAAARSLFSSRFGDTTSIRIAPTIGVDLKMALELLRSELGRNLNPKAGGFIYDSLEKRFAAAGKGSNDFGMLFLGFSFFLILAALLLVGLMFRLSVERRAKEFGLLEAVGFAPKAIRSMLLKEGTLVAVVGGLLGLLAAIAFAQGMLAMLKWLWPDESVRSFLKLHVRPTSLAIGLLTSLLMALLAMLWAVRLLKKAVPAALLKGATTNELEEMAGKQRPWLKWLAMGLVLVGLGTIAFAPKLPPGEPRAGGFFGGGFALLFAGLVYLWMRLKQPASMVTTTTKLGEANMHRNPTRGLLTAGLLAMAAFLLLAVESFRRQPEADFAQQTGGSGGYPYLMELDAPLFAAPNTPEFRNIVLDGLQKDYQRRKIAGDERENLRTADEKEWMGTKDIIAMRVRAGDDASCLNLYQATRPRVLGVPKTLDGFQFSNILDPSRSGWENLVAGEGKPTPFVCEENTATWMLKIGVGDTIELEDENGGVYQAMLVGTLKDSPFQSEVLIADADFWKHYPRREGFGLLLANLTDKERDQLAVGLAAFGPNVEESRARVAGYLQVQNTYLTTFQLLGGLGLLLGVLGMAAVLLRNVNERRSELALLSALGFSKANVRSVIGAENVGLLLTGLALGVITALVSILPATSLSAIPWLRLGLLLGLVVAVGLLVIRLAVRAALRQEIVPALRKE